MLKRSLNFPNRAILSLVLAAAFGWSLFSVDWRTGLLHPDGDYAAFQILQALVQPDLSPTILKLALTAAWRTLAYATAGLTLAILLGLVFGVLASGVLQSKRLSRLLVVVFFRQLLGMMRAIHELVWAWLLVAAMGLSPLAAVFALAIPYGGTLGRILADILNDVPQGPLKALGASGAGRFQMLFYSYLPMALADLVSYTMYRFECAIRSAAILSFVGLGGLGYQIQISLADLRYNEVWTFVFFLIGLVALVDFWSSQLRGRLVP